MRLSLQVTLDFKITTDTRSEGLAYKPVVPVLWIREKVECKGDTRVLAPMDHPNKNNNTIPVIVTFFCSNV